MGKKHKGKKMAAWRKYARAALGLAGVGIGGLVALSPTYRGLEGVSKGQFVDGANVILFDTTGLDVKNASSQPDVSKMIRTIVIAGAGVGIMFLFRKVARKV